MIRSFADRETEKLFRRERSRELPGAIQQAAHVKLLLIHAAEELGDLRSPPGNRLEKLHGDRQGQYSIRINQQWRVCFAWREGDAYEVEVVDYH